MRKLLVSEQLYILKFALANLPRDVFENIETPHLFSFVGLALLQQKSKSDFLSWLDAIPESIQMELFKVIRAAPNYLDGKVVVAFYGNSSYYKYKTNKVLVIDFCGVYGHMFMPISSYAYFFETRPDLSQLWLNDVSASNFAKGISGIGRNVLEMAVKLKSKIGECQFEKVVFIGNSAGGR